MTRIGVLTLAFAILVAVPNAGRAADTGTLVYKRSAPGVMLIRAFGVREDDTMYGEVGSGFVIGDAGLVLTASHVIPDEKKFKTLIIGGSLGPSSASSPAYKLELVKRSDTADVALLRVVGPKVRLTTLPLRASPAKVGEIIFVLGYPLGLSDTHFLDGRVGDVAADAVTTNALIDQGNSGGPVLDVAGCVVGVVFGGIQSREGQPVNGVKFAVPTASLRDWLPARLPLEGNVGSSGAAGDIIHVTDTLSRTQTIHGLKDTVRSYHDAIEARPGFLIEAIEAVGHVSLNPPELQFPTPSISPDAKSMTFDYSLVSGPVYDRRRGWIDMTIDTRQRRFGSPDHDDVAIGNCD